MAAHTREAVFDPRFMEDLGFFIANDRKLALRLIDLVQAMIRNAEVPLPDAIAMASFNPAREAGLSDKGEIAVGKDADLVVLSPELEVMRTYINGVGIFVQ